MRLIVDRTEGERVICEQEDGTMLELAAALFDPLPHDGDIVEWDGNEIIPNPAATAKRKQKLQSRFDRLKKKC